MQLQLVFSGNEKKSIISTMWPLDSHKREWASTNNHLSTFINYIPYISLLKHLWWLSPIISSGMSLAPLSLVAGCKCWGAESLNHRFFRPTSSACSIFSCTCRIMTIPKIFGSRIPIISYNHKSTGGLEHCPNVVDTSLIFCVSSVLDFAKTAGDSGKGFF